jgi:hypothetical protein
MTAAPSNIRAYAVAPRREDMPPSKETSNPCSNTLRPRRRHTDLRQPCAGSVRKDTAEQATPTTALAPPLPRNHQVLPSPSEARAHHDRQTRTAPSTDLGSCDPTGARRDTRRSSSSSSALRSCLVGASNLYSSARRRVEQRDWQRLLRRHAISTLDVQVGRGPSRRPRRSRQSAGAASSRVSGVAS